MVRSMTGYGRAEATLEEGKITVEVRSLNGKSADIGMKTSVLPKDREIAVRAMVAEKLQRGSIDFFMNWEPNAPESARTFNLELARSYVSQIRPLARECTPMGRSDEMDAAVLLSVMRMPELFETRRKDVVTDENWPVVEACIREALERIDAFRIREGEVLRRDVTAKVETILALSAEVETHEKERLDSVREKLTARMAELKVEADPSRLEQEMIFHIERLDINEERVRLRQHCRYYLETLENDPFPGKKLGFIAQEMGREINTTGSKANHTEIQKLVVRMKDELEKIKEQSLNIL